MSATRRGFLAGAAALPLAATAATPGPARAAAPLRARQGSVLQGRAIAAAPRARRIVVAHDRRRTIAIHRPGRGRPRLVDVGGQPLDVAVSPDGRLAAVTTASWDEPGLALVDLRTGAVRRAPAGPAPSCVAFAGDRIVVSGDDGVRVFDGDLAVRAVVDVGARPRGIAAHEGLAWIAVEAAGELVALDVRRGRVRRRFAVPALPSRIAVSPDGSRLLVAHAGRGTRVSLVSTRTGRVTARRAGRQPSGVAWTRGGRPVVALGGSGRIAVLGRRRRLAIGGAPRGLAVAGGRAWSADALTGAARAVRL